MSTHHLVTAAIVVIGNEVLSGRTQDTNTHYLAGALAGLGIVVKEVRVIPDDETVIIDAVNILRRRVNMVFTTGGIGPTHDDITSASIAKAFGVRLLRHPEAEQRLLSYYPKEKINDARLKMADIPEGATLIDNPVSIAPGFKIENVHVLAGVPSIMRAMFDGLRTSLVGGAKILSREITNEEIGEGSIAAELSAIQLRFPEIEIGSYPFVKNLRVGVSIVLRGYDESALNDAANEVILLLKQS